jgi:DNA-binding CsgD family transcriptional regulator
MDHKIKSACSIFQECHGLSSVESHIVYLLMIGHTPKQIADIRERSIETIRTQIKHIFNKVRINRTADLLSLVYRMMD